MEHLREVIRLATAGNITAVLTLNASKFNSGLESSLGALTKFQESIVKFNSNSQSMGKAIDELFTHLGHLNNELKLFNNSITNLNKFSQLSTAINKMANGLKILSSETIDVEQGINTMNNIFKAWGQTLNGTEIKVKGLVVAERELSSTSKMSVEAQRESANALNRNRDAVMRLISGENQLANTEREVASASMQESASVEKDAMSKDKASASTTKYANANKTLSSSLGMVRNALTLVGSMIAYNFIHNLGVATTETINAKSEMNGYFQMLGYGKAQVNDFNKALDETIAKFPRLNKYALGETISSIGVEFELTTAEMKKAMPVVSMITSEYLRAGRNVNEASLAVKDILQGEFQRLSRETGVKGKQLEEAGWSGDKNDVMGLLEALDKVGKSRNWDKFVAKANSLNDAVLITQNRFSEWSADMVERVQPAILGVFNDIMVVASSFAEVLNSALDWLSGDGIAQSIVKWGGLATILGTVATALVHLRTGANLMQIAQMGLSGSIGATILGLEAETVAQYDLTTAIAMSVTGLEAEELAQMGKYKAILSTIIGLDLATVKEYGFRTALLSSVTGVEAETIALEGLNAEMLVSIATFSAFALALAVVTGALIVQAIEINKTTEKYKKFVEIVNNGDTIINDAKSTVDSLTEKQNNLKSKLAELEEGTAEYNITANKLKTTTDDLTTATRNYEDAVNSVAWARHKQDLYDDIKQEKSLEVQRDINQALIDYGVNVEEANQISSPFWQEALDGWDQQYETLQKVNNQLEKNKTTVDYWLQELRDAGKDPTEISILIKPIIKSGRTIAERKEELGQAQSLTEYVDKWLWLQVAEIDHSIKEFDLNLATKGLADALMGLVWGLINGLGDMFVGQFTQGLARSWGLEGKGKELGDAFQEFIRTTVTDFFNGTTIQNALQGHTLMGDLTWLYDVLLKPIVDFIQGGGLGGLVAEKLGDWNLVDFIMDSILGKPVSAENGEDHPDVQTEIDQVVFQPIRDVLSDFISNPMTYLAFGNGMSVATLIESLFTVDVGSIQEWVQSNIIQPLIDAVTWGIENTPVLGDIAKLLGLGEDPETEAHDKGQSVGDSFNVGISTGLSGVDQIIHGAFEGLGIDDLTSQFMSNASEITSTATSTASNVAGSFSTMKNNQRSSLDSMVSKNTTAFEDMKTTSNAKMVAMRDSTSQVTQQMTSAWTVMKDSILASAKKIRDDSKQRFDELSTTIGGFYRKIQNPSQWAGSPSLRSNRSPNRSAGRTFSSILKPNGYSGGGSRWTGDNTMTVASLKQKLCPNGACGNLFDGYKNTDVIDVPLFLSMVGEGHGFGGWNFATEHNKFIKDKSDAWQTGSPVIQLLGGIGTSTHFKVGEFNDGTPKISWDAFQSMAGAIFSAIPYKFYYDSSWKGSWLGALQSGACNCYDGALALIAFANACGFSGSMAHGTWTDPDGQTYGHVWAVINGHKMDTTGWQNRGTWTPSASAGSPNGARHYSGSNGGKTVNITVDMSNSVIYGVEDLDGRIEDATKRAMREEFNDPYTVTI